MKAEIDTAIEILKKEYDRALKQTWVKNPLAYALYQTWNQFDKKGGKRMTKEIAEEECQTMAEAFVEGYHQAIDDVIQKVKSMGLSGISSSQGNLIYVLEIMKGDTE